MTTGKSQASKSSQRSYIWFTLRFWKSLFLPKKKISWFVVWGCMSLRSSLAVLSAFRSTVSSLLKLCFLSASDLYLMSLWILFETVFSSTVSSWATELSKQGLQWSCFEAVRRIVVFWWHIPSSYEYFWQLKNHPAPHQQSFIHQASSLPVCRKSRATFSTP